MPKKSITIDENKVEIKKSIKLEGKIWEEFQSKATAGLTKNLKINGFRKGKVPANIALKHISEATILQTALNNYMNSEYKNILDEFKKETTRLVAVEPRVNVKSISREVVDFEVIYPLDADLSKISDKDVKVKFELPKVTDADVKKYIEDKLKETALQMPLDKKEKTALGDTVTLNYKGYVNDEAFDGGQAEKFELKLGSKTFIDTFEDQLVGKTIGYKGEVVVTFPKEYPVDKLAGQKATFDVEILDAKRPEKSELTEENLYILRAGQSKTVEEAKNVLKWVILNNEIEFSLNKYIETYVSETLAKNDVKINDIFIHYQVAQKRQQVIEQLKQQGIKFDEYLKVLDKTEAEFNELVFKEEKQAVAFSMVAQHLLGAVSDKNQEVTTEELTNWANTMSMSTGLPASFLSGFFMQDENNKTQMTQRLLEKRHIKALLAAKDSEAATKLSKLEEELNSEAAKIAEEWLKRAEELKSSKEEELAEQAVEKQAELDAKIAAKTKKSSK
ncbi:peptidylprolyl isomerase (trigger factor) [Mycoplasmopsis californica]|uniref:Trigger factor n=1 Tax=Mycoplasmopsis californica TaxID=2113 RepID=A0A059XV71_9BACT|nr:trigger factor [Mycoplasmopsis californica]AIA29221.1 peptidylprolyl isomerase (trigger factor) [Mycoplasmopsis californica]